MKIERVKDFLINLYKKETSLLILGPPGIGKSTVTNEAGKQIAQLEKLEFIDYDDSVAEKILAKPERYFVLVDFRLTEVEPTDLLGIPKESQNGIRYMPFLWATVLSKTKGILFLDEFTNIQRLDVISAAYKLVFDHKAGFTRFNKDVMVIAAGNCPEESSVSNLLPAPLIDRFTVLKTECPTIEAWTEWMDKNFDIWDRRTLGYLKHFSQELLKMPSESETLENFPSPRGWTRVATLLPNILKSYWSTVIDGRLGVETGQKFSAFLETDIPSIEEIIKRPNQFTELSLDQKYLVSVLIGDYLGRAIENDPKIKSVTPLLKTMDKEFSLLSIISSGSRKRELALKLIKIDEEIKSYLEEISMLRAEVGN